VERLAYWLCSGLTSLGIDGTSSDDATPSRGGAASAGRKASHDAPRDESRIRYPLRVDGWRAVDEHVYDDPEYGVSVRYAHGQDRDRWIDVYFYPAGALSTAEFQDAAEQEAEMIQEAHLLAGYEDFDMSPLCGFSLAGDARAHGESVDGLALDLSYAVDGVKFSSAMTLLLDRQYFVKARFSVEHRILSRPSARAQLLEFTGRLQPRLSILTPSSEGARSRAHASIAELPAGGMREIRLPSAAATSPTGKVREAADAG
jgi:hypothetical protein